MRLETGYGSVDGETIYTIRWPLINDIHGFKSARLDFGEDGLPTGTGYNWVAIANRFFEGLTVKYKR